MLGIIIGVGSVIAMLAIGEGSKLSIQQQIAEMGSNMIMIRPGAENRGGVRQSGESMQTLKLEDYYAIKHKTHYVEAVSPTVSSGGQFIFGSRNYPSTLTGVNADYLTIRRLTVNKGIVFNEHQVSTSAKVCLIGKTIVDNLFLDGEDPVGKVIRFNKIPFTIIGTLQEKGFNSMGVDQDNVALAPYTTVQKRVLAITYIHGINASAISEDATQLAIDEITNILRANHKLREGSENDFNVRSQQELSNMMTSTTDLLTVLLACIAGISLLVGGIGVMNIMYVSVTERTKEIGLRMSIGAKGRDILGQFLIEAVLISCVGGLIGVFIGVGAAFVIKSVFMWPIYIQGYSIVLSFTVCTLTGIFFGWYPAKKASNLDPIEAIRYE
jgi:putative ABC transport system permease protein